MKTRLLLAFASYALLGVMACLTLSDWRFRGTVLVLLAALAVKTWVATRQQR